MSDDSAEKLLASIEADAWEAGYNLNPDTEMTRMLARGIQANIERYGYGLCPCRLTGGSMEADTDIICPCDYRDDDVDEYDSCY